MLAINNNVYILFLLLLCASSAKGFDIEFTVKGVTCYGGSDGTAAVEMLGGTPPFRALWNELKRETLVVDGLQGGFYTVLVTDDEGVKNTSGCYVPQPPELSIQVVTDVLNKTHLTRDVLCYGGSDGVVSVVAEGGTPPYTYEWSYYSDGNSINGNVTTVAPFKPLVFFDEANGDEISITPSEYVSIANDDGYTHSGLKSIQLGPSQSVVFQCSQTTACMNAQLYLGIEAWVRFDWSLASDIEFAISDGTSTLITRTLLEVLNSVGDYFGDKLWAEAVFSFATVPLKNYTNFSIANKSPTSNQITLFVDDVVMVPKPGQTGFLEQLDQFKPLPIGATSSVYGKSGYYVPTVVDQNNCKFYSMSLTVHQPDRLEISASDRGDASALISVTGGVGPYEYIVGNTVQDSDIVRDLQPGSHTVTVIDANNCYAYSVVDIARPFASILQSFFSVVKVLMAVVSGLLMCFAIACGVFLKYNWKNVHPHNPGFCVLIIIGAFIGYFGVFYSSVHTSVASCTEFLWFLGLSFAFVYGTLFGKHLLVMKILHDFPKFLPSDGGMKLLLKILGGFLLLEGIYLFGWTVGDTPQVVKGTYSAQTCHLEHGATFWTFFVLFKVIVVSVGGVLSFRTRRKFEEFVELKHIAHSFYFVVVAFTVAIPVCLISRNYSDVSDFFMMLFVLLAVSYPLITVMGFLMKNRIDRWRHVVDKGKGWQQLRTVKY